MDFPSVEHVFFIPLVLLIGFTFGYRRGAAAARAELEQKQRERRK